MSEYHYILLLLNSLQILYICRMIKGITILTLIIYLVFIATLIIILVFNS